MRLTIIPGVLELRISFGEPSPVQRRLPKFSQDSLESLAIAISMLRDEEHLRVHVYPSSVLNEEMLAQLPEGLR